MSDGYACKNCGFTAEAPLPRCPRCHYWASFRRDGGPTNVSERSYGLDEIDRDPIARRQTGFAWLDDVLHGGLVDGCVYLLAGDPGGGKSTLASQVSVAFERPLWVTGEESKEEVSARMHRLRIRHPGFRVREAWDLEAAIDDEGEDPDFIVADSAHMLASRGVGGLPGSVSQIVAVTQFFMHECRERRVPGILIAHVNKDGDMSGPNAARHLVTCPMLLSTSDDKRTRVLGVEKNRHGPAPATLTGLVLTERGLRIGPGATLTKNGQESEVLEDKERHHGQKKEKKQKTKAAREQVEAQKNHAKSEGVPKKRFDPTRRLEEGLEDGALGFEVFDARDSAGIA